MLRLPVPARLRRAARRRRGLRGPGPEDPRRRPEPPVRRRLVDRLRRLAPGRRVPGQQPERRRRVRVRLVLPRRGRRAGLGGLAPPRAPAACALAGGPGLVLAACGGGGGPPGPPPPPPPPGPPPAAPPPPPPPGVGGPT